MEELTASVYYRDANGNETPLAGMAMSGALVPSTSYMRSGTVSAQISSLDNLAQVQVTFSSPMPDDNYMVNIEVAGWGGAGNLGTNISITQKSANGFLIRQYVSAEVSTTSMIYRWTAFKLNTTEQIALDEGQIEQNKTDIATIYSKMPFYKNISNSSNNVGQDIYVNLTNSMQVALTIMREVKANADTTRKLTPYIGHMTAYTTDGTEFPNVGVATYIASACWGANGNAYIRMRIMADTGNEYEANLDQNGTTYGIKQLSGIETGTITRNTSISESMNEEFLQKTGRVAQLHANINGCVITGGELTTIATVSAGFLPACQSWMLVDADYVADGVRCFMDASGNIQVLFPQSGTYNIRIDKTYIVAS